MIRALIVDDHKLMGQGLRLVLQTQPDIRVLGIASNTDEAWAKVVQHRPDLVLMDLELPGEDGLELTARILPSFPETRIIVVTGHSKPRMVEKALAVGASGYVVKTSGGAELLAAIRAVFEGKVYLCSNTTTAMHAANTSANAAESNHDLSPREMQVLRLVLGGRRNKEIAAELNLGIKTVETYRSRVMRKFNCTTPAELARVVVSEGIVTL